MESLRRSSVFGKEVSSHPILRQGKPHSIKSKQRGIAPALFFFAMPYVVRDAFGYLLNLMVTDMATEMG